MLCQWKKIKELAEQVGFDACGLCQPIVDESTVYQLNNWLQNGFHGEMSYMENNLNIRQNPQLLVENAKTVVSVLLSYNYKFEEKCNFPIAKFALLRDYHIVVKEKLSLLLTEIQKIQPEITGRCFVDSAPVLERYFAQKAGLGFVGRNHCLINEQLGSYVYIGEIIGNFSTDYDQPDLRECANCGACISSCKTNALCEKCFDARKCHSYLTIERKQAITADEAQRTEKYIFGCDACQECCPHNFSAKQKNGKILPEIQSLTAEEISKISNRQFLKKFGDTSLARAGRKKMMGNIEAVMNT